MVSSPHINFFFNLFLRFLERINFKRNKRIDGNQNMSMDFHKNKRMDGIIVRGWIIIKIKALYKTF